MIVAFPRRSSLPTNLSNSAALLAAQSAMRRAIDKLQRAVLENPRIALVVIGLLEGWLDD